MFSWWNPSGGFFYHYLAWRYQNTLWKSFHEPLQRWLLTWTQKNPTLVLFGASGGYALQLPFLKRYSKIIVVEPDPIARHVFKKRFEELFRQREVEWLSDKTILLDHELGVESLKAWLLEHPKSDLLFCNVIGQLPLFFPSHKPEYWENWKIRFQELMENHHFATFHDVCSSNRYPENWRHHSGGPIKNLSELFGDRIQAEVNDHQTSNLFSNLPRSHFLWRISTSRFHLIEGIHT